LKRLGIIALFVVLLIQPFVLSAEQTEDEKRREILQFGLEPEITELIGTLQKEENKTFNDDILNVFNSTKNPVLRESVLSFFAAQKDPALKDFALSTLTDPWDFKTSTVIAVLSYAESISLKEATPSIRKILDGESNEYRAKALSTLGKLGSAEDARYLVESLDGDIPGDDKQKLIIRQNIMAALGELRAVETWDRLVEIAKDTDENAVIRATAATAIGKMGKPEAIPVLSALFEDTDPVLRTAAIEGLSNYSEPGAVSVVLQGFKDSYYKVRLAALAAAGNTNIRKRCPTSCTGQRTILSRRSSTRLLMRQERTTTRRRMPGSGICSSTRRLRTRSGLRPPQYFSGMILTEFIRNSRRLPSRP